jgi:hypothetical protein
MRISRTGLIAVLALMLLLVSACASGATETTEAAAADPTTTAADEPTTTEATEETSDPGSVGSLGDMPAECVEAFRTFLREIEPIVEDFDFESATMADLETLGTEFETLSTDFEEETASCPELDATTEESFAAMIEFARNEAPGTVGYFEFLQQFATAASGTVSEDCETNIAAAQEFVDRGGSMQDLTLAESTQLGQLFAAISNTCSPERAGEWFAEEDVNEFMSS